MSLIIVLGEYLYNANGQRVKKTANGRITYFIYDQSGNLIEEADESGQVNSDYIYLGSVPIARVDEWWEGMPMPQAPTGLNITPGDTQLTAMWNPNTDTGTDTVGVDGYKVYWGTASKNYTSSMDVGKVNSYTIMGLTNGTTYYVSVTAYADIKRTLFYHTDHIGTPVLMTDSNGNKVWEGEFLPFGETLSITGSVINNKRFPGQYADKETGLSQNGQRDYHDIFGRYKEADPILRFIFGQQIKTCSKKATIAYFNNAINKPVKLNPYIYASNNPINNVDPTGLESCNGRWSQVGWDRIYNAVCVCYWLCVPCNGSTIWGGDPRTLPKTIGTVINAGSDIESGDDCVCKKQGTEKGCCDKK